MILGIAGRLGDGSTLIFYEVIRASLALAVSHEWTSFFGVAAEEGESAAEVARHRSGRAAVRRARQEKVPVGALLAQRPFSRCGCVRV